jgi:hypothetical protein
VNLSGKPDAGHPLVRFDEGDQRNAGPYSTAFSRSDEFQPDSTGQLEPLMTQERAKTRENARMDPKWIQEP